MLCESKGAGMITCPSCSHKFTEEEFQDICHNLSPDDEKRFKEGCMQTQVKLFGDRWLKLPKECGYWYKLNTVINSVEVVRVYGNTHDQPQSYRGLDDYTANPVIVVSQYKWQKVQLPILPEAKP